MRPSCVSESRQKTQRLLQSNVSRTQLRFSWAACSWPASRWSATPAACASSVSIADDGNTPRAAISWTRMRVLVVHPPVSVARDFIDYPYFADLGAVQLAGVLAARGDGVELCDAYALDGSTLVWRPDGRAHLG